MRPAPLQAPRQSSRFKGTYGCSLAEKRSGKQPSSFLRRHSPAPTQICHLWFRRTIGETSHNSKQVGLTFNLQPPFKMLNYGSTTTLTIKTQFFHRLTAV